MDILLQPADVQEWKIASCCSCWRIGSFGLIHDYCLDFRDEQAQKQVAVSLLYAKTYAIFGI
jgi:hypothetical protein